ncbi:hypothetical protein [Rhodococcus cercidiphylli]|uniref:Lipoprotein n=1 Tax=Rhodococcus cercidiphylli TaxID=489916 RepID=A0ABU4AWM4_9NOCA|nr:hypothetical protein [Rhodococcus cercidiphylli]MDV6230633.1 hypothetical protein [Rhodococcus cercidiphylli]
MNRLKAAATVAAAGVLLVVTGCSSDSSEDDGASTVTATTTSTEAAQPVPAVAASTAESVCAQIEDAGIGANCVRGEGNGLALAATEVYDFDLPSVPGEGGAVMAFDDVDLYRKTVQSYEDAAFLAGPHRYGSEPALIFVQINEGMSPSDGQKVKGIVDAL